jgi:glycosyltransferase involved in cell wall biosynthesis
MRHLAFHSVLSGLRAAAHPARASWRELCRRVWPAPRFENVAGASDAEGRPRALLDYLSHPFAYAEGDARFFLNQNLRQSRRIAEVLAAAGFVVDVTDVSDHRPPPRRRYSLVISHRVDFPWDAVSGTPVFVYLATGMNHRVSNANLRARLARLEDRRGCRVKARRLFPEAMPYVERADAIACFGDAYTAATWRELTRAPVHCFNNYGFPEIPFLRRDFSEARRRFLFMSSGGQVLKGLDLLLDLFARHDEWELYICSDFRNERDFCACYREALFRKPNIHAVGRVRVEGPVFGEIARRCAFLIHPSCSDAQPGSIMQALQTGMMPVVTRECGFSVGSFGFLLPDDGLESMAALVRHLSEQPEQALAAMSRRARQAAEADFSESAFLERWREIVRAVMRASGAGSLSTPANGGCP